MQMTGHFVPAVPDLFRCDGTVPVSGTENGGVDRVPEL
jgi:hypothetical protein